jgi:ubiquinone/menaquinone biosynthesis C-methylase UbiE
MERKEYMLKVYGAHWHQARYKVFKFLQFDKSLCQFIVENVPKGGSLLEVAIGNGYPIGDHLQHQGYNVHGIDLSPLLIEEAKKLNPHLHCRVGDAENLPYQDGHFDCTYCFHSSWYFSDLFRGVDEMLRVTRPGGLVMLDIMNRNNSEIESMYRRNLSPNVGFKRIVLFLKNVVRLFTPRFGPTNWHSLIYEAPTTPGSVYEHLAKRDIDSYHVLAREKDDSLRLCQIPSSFSEYPRLIFVVRTSGVKTSPSTITSGTQQASR